MKPVEALRNLGVAAGLIPSAPQTGAAVVDALKSLTGRVERWRLLYLWEYFQSDKGAEPNRLIDAHQNLTAALNGIAHDLTLELLGPVELAALAASRGNAISPGPN